MPQLNLGVRQAGQLQSVWMLDEVGTESMDLDFAAFSTEVVRELEGTRGCDTHLEVVRQPLLTSNPPRIFWKGSARPSGMGFCPFWLRVARPKAGLKVCCWNP